MAVWLCVHVCECVCLMGRGSTVTTKLSRNSPDHQRLNPKQTHGSCCGPEGLNAGYSSGPNKLLLFTNFAAGRPLASLALHLF